MRNFASVLLAVLLLSGCRSGSDTPVFTASGYVADYGTVRIWRKENAQQVTHLLAIYTPFSGREIKTTDYLWQANKLIAFERRVTGEHPAIITLRFDQDGNLSFMQRQTEGRREMLSADEIAYYRFDAQKVLKNSNDLLAGKIILKQGRWLSSGKIMRCDGVLESPDIDPEMLHSRHDGTDSVAWLVAPSGTQLLKVSGDNLCASAPAEADF